MKTVVCPKLSAECGPKTFYGKTYLNTALIPFTIFLPPIFGREEHSKPPFSEHT